MGRLNIRTRFDVVTGRVPGNDASAPRATDVRTRVPRIPARRDLSVWLCLGVPLPTNRAPGAGAVCLAASHGRICVRERTAQEQLHPAASLLNQMSDVPLIS